MADFRTSDFSRPFGGPDIRSSVATGFLASVYRWMALGLLLTAGVAMAIASNPDILRAVVTNKAIFYGAMIAQFVLVLAFTPVAARASTAATAGMFLAYSALMGVTLSTLFLRYTGSALAETFFITSGSFAGLSLYGSTTKRDLTAVGQFMFIGLIGLVIASVVNIFVASSAIYWISTYAGVLIFAGLTAYDTQKLKELAAQGGTGGNLALRGALTLYLDFINMFLFLLRLFGGGRRD